MTPRNPPAWHGCVPVLVSALHKRSPIGTVHIVTVSHKISHCFVEFYDAAMIAIHNNPHTLSHAPHRQIGIKRNIPSLRNAVEAPLPDADKRK